jgi:hypothetical protein
MNKKPVVVISCTMYSDFEDKAEGLYAEGYVLSSSYIGSIKPSQYENIVIPKIEGIFVRRVE